MTKDEWFEIFDLTKSSMSGNGNLKINKQIRHYVRKLIKDYDYTYAKLHDFRTKITLDFICDYYEKYDKTKSGLKHYLNGYVLFKLKERIRALDRHREMFSNTPTIEEVEDHCNDQIDYWLFDKGVNVEDEVIGRDLFARAEKLDDTKNKLCWRVLNEEMSQTDAAKQLKISKQAFHVRYNKYKEKIVDKLELSN